MNKIPMTAEGAERLRQELERLKKVERPRIVRAIAEARAHGDLRENAEYHAAREQQSFVEGRILEIEAKLSRAQIIDVRAIPPSDRVIFGCTVTILNLAEDTRHTYKIVGDDEADLKEAKISYQSPLARALIGKEVGEVVRVAAPSGEVEYEIERVEHL
ncbi:MAG: transcription elongation factor GreA [Porticoccaceae bacterium]|nr:MAG: transcription elongation factor GreA [Porticoccaceae bacterium]